MTAKRDDTTPRDSAVQCATVDARPSRRTRTIAKTSATPTSLAVSGRVTWNDNDRQPA